MGSDVHEQCDSATRGLSFFCVQSIIDFAIEIDAPRKV